MKNSVHRSSSLSHHMSLLHLPTGYLTLQFFRHTVSRSPISHHNNTHLSNTHLTIQQNTTRTTTTHFWWLMSHLQLKICSNQDKHILWMASWTNNWRVPLPSFVQMSALCILTLEVCMGQIPDSHSCKILCHILSCSHPNPVNVFPHPPTKKRGLHYH